MAAHLLGVDKKPTSKPRVWAIDILPMDPIPAVRTLQGDFLSPSVRETLQSLVGTPESGGGVDTILSDMMAPMTGVRTRDVGLSLKLCAAATVFARGVLKQASKGDEAKIIKGKKVWPGGNLVWVSKFLSGFSSSLTDNPYRMKFFAHPDLDEFRKLELDQWFGRVVIEKPKESRSGKYS